MYINIEDLEKYTRKLEQVKSKKAKKHRKMIEYYHKNKDQNDMIVTLTAGFGYNVRKSLY